MQEINLEFAIANVKKNMDILRRRHSVDITDFINLDEDIRNDYSGDWSDEDIERWEYLCERLTVLVQAENITKEEMICSRIGGKNASV